MGIFVTTLAELPAWMLVTIGFYVSYRVLRFPDLTVDASFLVGTVVCGCLALHYQSSFWGLIVAIIFGGLAGLLTSTIYLSNPRPAYKLLAGLLVIFTFYSINYRLLGRRVSIGFSTQSTFMNKIADYESQWGVLIYKPLRLSLGLLLVIAVVILLSFFFRTLQGLLIRSIGTRRSLFCIGKPNIASKCICLGLVISNMIVALGGWLYASVSGYAYINIFGTIMHALAAAIIGELIVERLPFGKDNRSSVRPLIAAPLIGATLYHFFRTFVAWLVTLESQGVTGDTISIHQQDQNTFIAICLIGLVLLIKHLFSKEYTMMAADQDW